MIKVNNLYKSFGSNNILENICLEVKEKEIVVLYGRNGTGKTTLIKCIIGLLNLDKGRIDLSWTNEIGVVLNNQMLINKLTVFEYLEFVCLLKQMNKKVYNKKIEKLIKYIDIDNDRNKLIEELSNGTKSKLKLIASIIFDPKILLLDEPFSGMDIIAIEKSIKLINKKASDGCSILISTHNLDVVGEIKADLFILKNKTITDIITKEQICFNKNNLKEFLLTKI